MQEICLFSADLLSCKEGFMLIFIIVLCILKSILFTHQQMHYLLNLERFKIYTRIHTHIAPFV
jgi:hypothetical protein